MISYERGSFALVMQASGAAAARFVKKPSPLYHEESGLAPARSEYQEHFGVTTGSAATPTATAVSPPSSLVVPVTGMLCFRWPLALAIC